MSGAVMTSKPSVTKSSSSVSKKQKQDEEERVSSSLFAVSYSRNKTMPVTRAEYEAVPEWKLHCLCTEYGMLSTIKGQFGGFF